jgi:ABC-type dipeptide/oligopeptide/nickel transport system permease component
LVQPGQSHWLGADSLGRDTLSRLIFGSRNSLMVGVVALGIAAAIGITMGLLAGYFGGWVYTVIMRFIDSLMCFPMILLALLIASLLGGGIKNVMYARIDAAQLCRLMRCPFRYARLRARGNSITRPPAHAHIFAEPAALLVPAMQLAAMVNRPPPVGIERQRPPGTDG